MTAQKKKPQDEEKQILVHCYCYAEKREITPNECLVVSISKRNNRKYCKRNECESLSRLCLSCVIYDEVDDDSIVESLGASLCEFHALNGYFARKNENLESLEMEMLEQSKSIKNCIELRSKYQNNKYYEDVLYDVEEDLLGNEIEDIQDEIPSPLEQDEVTEQEIDTTLKQEDF